MPNWNQILDEIKKTASIHDATRRRYLSKLHKLTGRNIILYYSGWLQSPDAPPSDAVLSVHHCCVHTLSQTHAVKIIENHNGIAFVNVVQQVVMKPT
jgi:hypothetical protein